ncbi:MAG: nucleoside-diphosphate kinase [Nitrospirota bacterium]
MNQRTFFMLKPDGVKLEEQILAKIKSVAEIITVKEYNKLPLQKIEELYEEHKDKAFYPWLVAYLKDKPAKPMIVEKNDGLSEDLFSLIAQLVGSTDPKKALPGTIRSMSSDSLEIAMKENRAVQNLVHRAENWTAAQREIAIFFPEMF